MPCLWRNFVIEFDEACSKYRGDNWHNITPTYHLNEVYLFAHFELEVAKPERMVPMRRENEEKTHNT